MGFGKKEIIADLGQSYFCGGGGEESLVGVGGGEMGVTMKEEHEDLCCERQQ